jgi:DNA-binding NarL/FixJ family response regulator
MDEAVRFLIADDHPIFRQGVAAVIRSIAHYRVCAEACTMREALEAARREVPDVALIDISLAGDAGLDLARRIKADRPEVKTLVLSIHDEPTYADLAFKAEASGYVMKHEAGTVLLEAIRTVLAGGTFISPSVRKTKKADPYDLQED